MVEGPAGTGKTFVEMKIVRELARELHKAELRDIAEKLKAEMYERAEKRSAEAKREVDELTEKLIAAEWWRAAVESEINERQRAADEHDLIPIVDPSTGYTTGYTMQPSGPEAAPVQPPIAAERLLSLIVSPDRLEEKLGDFEERFGFMTKRHGVGHARCWYWWQVSAIIVRGGLKAALQAAKIGGGFGSA